jgi:hypothetical protein
MKRAKRNKKKLGKPVRRPTAEDLEADQGPMPLPAEGQVCQDSDAVPYTRKELQVIRRCQHALDRWVREICTAAKADNCAILRDHLRRLRLPDSSELLLAGTICAVRAWWYLAGFACGYYDGFDSRLEMQQYDPADAANAVYAFTFDFSGKSFARLLVDTKVGNLDLADMHEGTAYDRFWISRTDWEQLDSAEVQQLKDEVTSDLRYDYAKYELDIFYRQSRDHTNLGVVLQDR